MRSFALALLLLLLSGLLAAGVQVERAHRHRAAAKGHAHRHSDAVVAEHPQRMRFQQLDHAQHRHHHVKHHRHSHRFAQTHEKREEQENKGEYSRTAALAFVRGGASTADGHPALGVPISEQSSALTLRALHASKGALPSEAAQRKAAASQADSRFAGHVALPALAASRVEAEEAQKRIDAASRSAPPKRSQDTQSFSLPRQKQASEKSSKQSGGVRGSFGAATLSSSDLTPSLAGAAPDRDAETDSFIGRAAAMSGKLVEAKATSMHTSSYLRGGGGGGGGGGGDSEPPMAGVDDGEGTGLPPELRPPPSQHWSDPTVSFEGPHMPAPGSSIGDLSNIAREPDMPSFAGRDDLSGASGGVDAAIRDQPPAAVPEFTAV